MWNVYLSESSMSAEWRDQFKEKISKDIKIFDPSHFDNNSFEKKTEAMKSSDVVVFYFSEKWNGSYGLLELGESVGIGKQIIVCMKGYVTNGMKLRNYCQHHGALVCENMNDLVSMTKEYLKELTLLH